MYQELNASTVADYVRGRPNIARHMDLRNPTIREVSDGNLNAVFLVSDESHRSAAIKQALPYVRVVGPSWPLSLDRVNREADALQRHAQIAPEMVPAVIDFDPEQHVLTMEDLSDHTVWRTSLNAGVHTPGVAEALGGYVARVLIYTSPLGIEESDYREDAQRHANIELCRITEDLIFTDPYTISSRNSFPGELAKSLALITGNKAVLASLGRLRFLFATRSDALIHGDLHTGSVFVRPASPGVPLSVKAFDHEFAFYGPVSFDLGLIIGNLFHAAARAQVLGDTQMASSLLDDSIELLQSFKKTVAELSQRTAPGFNRAFIDQLMREQEAQAIGFAAAESLRRVVGLAKTSDIQSLDEHHVVVASDALVRLSSELLSDWPHATVEQASSRAGDILRDLSTGHH